MTNAIISSPAMDVQGVVCPSAEAYTNRRIAVQSAKGAILTDSFERPFGQPRLPDGPAFKQAGPGEFQKPSCGRY
jgi:hypothetical protein